jgi:hypothetical protein
MNSQFDDRLTPLTHIKQLETLRFWLTHTERVRSMEASPSATGSGRASIGFAIRVSGRSMFRRSVVCRLALQRTILSRQHRSARHF